MPLLLILAVIIFVIADIIIRLVLKKVETKKLRKEREAILTESLTIDFSIEAKSLKRASVQNPKAKILCVDDEDVILDSFRKILVLDGYSVDTVTSGGEALGLIKSNHYDFVFTDLKMPEMDGVDVTKAVKSVRPDIDVIIITGYATVETAVDCMKFGAMDYIQKPFTEDELLEYVKNFLVRREDRIKKQLKPRVHITHLNEEDKISFGEFAIPGGVFISEGHCWASVTQDGTVKIGIDDFAKKLIGQVDDIEFPNLGMSIEKGQPLFSIIQGKKSVKFLSPISGVVAKTNSGLTENPDLLNFAVYETNWIASIDADNLDTELPLLKIGRNAVLFFQEEIDRFVKTIKNYIKEDKSSEKDFEYLWKQVENLDEKNWYSITGEFFNK